MALLKTFRLTPNTVASTGSPQVQPLNDSPVAEAKKFSTGPNVTQNATDATISNISAISQVKPNSSKTSGFTVVSNSSINTLAKQLISDPTFIIPQFQSKKTRILPSFLAQKKSESRRDSSDDSIANVRKFEPYEKLTGISHDRPEIIMLSDFSPLFNKNVIADNRQFSDLLKDGGINPYFTDAGWFFDTQIQLRNLLVSNVVSSHLKIRKKDPEFVKISNQRRGNFDDTLSDLSTASSFLLDLVDRVNKIKNQLDLRDDIFIVDIPVLVGGHLKNHTKSAGRLKIPNKKDSTPNDSELLAIITKYVPTKYDIPNALERLGYGSESTTSIFSSTKLWLQLLLEYKSILRDHSLEFLDIEPSSQRNDTSPMVLNFSREKLFGILPQDPPGMPSFQEFLAIQKPAIPGLIRTVERAFNVIYERVTFKTEEEHISALANFLSKEFRYSWGLSDTKVRSVLTNFYQYQINDTGNLQLFDAIVGQFPNNVSEFPAIETPSLAHNAYKQLADNIAVLNFESKYIEGDNGVLTPGATAYIDDIFRTDGQSFNVERLIAFARSFDLSFKAFNTIINGMNLLGSFSTIKNQAHSWEENTFGNPLNIIQGFVKHLIDDNGNVKKDVTDDKLTALFTLAATNPRIKSLLFTIVANQISRSTIAGVPSFASLPFSDNTPATDAVIDMIVNELASIVKVTKQTTNTSLTQALFNLKKPPPGLKRPNPPSYFSISAHDISTAIKSKFGLMARIRSLLEFSVNIFKKNERVFLGDRARYSGNLDSVTIMIMFDMFVRGIALFGNTQFMGRFSSGGRTLRPASANYIVSTQPKNRNQSKNDIINRLSKELTLTHQLSFCVLNTLDKLPKAVKGMINYLEDPTTVKNLKEISGVLDDQQMLEMLMNEHQIQMFGANVRDIIGKFSQKGRLGLTYRGFDVDGDGDFDANDQIKVLDESGVNPLLRDAIYATFGSSDFALEKAFNKKIITVGIPLGFSRRLKQKVNLSTQRKTSFKYKQNDIVNVTVYKIDMLNQDLIYKPKKFLFELSRFPVRDATKYKPISDEATQEVIMSSIPTRDFEEAQEEGSADLMYWNPKGSLNVSDALNASTYDFLTVEEKSNIIKNHITSYLLEVYLRVMTGISTAEIHFDIKEPPRPISADYTEQMIQAHFLSLSSFANIKNATTFRTTSGQSISGLKKVSKQNIGPVGGLMFSTTLPKKLIPLPGDSSKPPSQAQPTYSTAAGRPFTFSLFGGIKIPSISGLNPSPSKKGSLKKPKYSGSSSNIDYRKIPFLLQQLKTVSATTRMVTTMSDGLAISKQLLMPKQFDRVFNIVVDPDEFELDYEKTTKNPQGSRSFREMLSRGDVVLSDTSEIDRRYNQRLPLSSGARRRTGRLGFAGSPEPSPVANYKFRDRDKNEGDLSFEKYFVTVETYDEEGV